MDRYFTYDLYSLCLQKSIPSNTLFASTVCRYCHQISKSNASYFWVNNGNLDEGITFKYWCQWLTSAMHIMNIGIEFVGWCLFILKIFIIKGITYEINYRWHLCGLCPEQSSLQIQCNIAVQWVHEWVVLPLSRQTRSFLAGNIQFCLWTETCHVFAVQQQRYDKLCITHKFKAKKFKILLGSAVN